MADITLSLPLSRYPEGTTVEVYEPGGWTNGIVDQKSAPVGSPVDDADVTDGELAFTGLDDGGTYVAYAEVASQHRYTEFSLSDVSNTGLVNQAQLTEAVSEGGLSEAEVQALIDASIATHAADTTAVHGISNTALLALAADLEVLGESVFVHLLRANSRFTTAAVTATDYFLSGSSDTTIFAVGTSPGGQYSWGRYFDPAKFARTGYTTKMRSQMVAAAGATGFGQQITCGLYPFTIVAGTSTKGTLVPNSQHVLAAPAVNSFVPDYEEFDAPAAAGWYAPIVTFDGTVDANVSLHYLLELFWTKN